MTGMVKGILNVDIYVADVADAINAVEQLKKAFKDAFVDSDDRHITLYEEETAKYYYSPAVYTLSNGDPGYPEEYEDELSYYGEDDIKDCVTDALKGIEFDFEDISYERVYGDRGY